ncbi:hypothetical protein BBOV_III002660 [Babesia bovis T2Bo]|uniref:Cytidyltransferase-like domain-containing protein n=1 Tax=Babesia bovis TaxID=5865 RepID=A7AMP7_BABBO|nr:hypothetical protein BBOV_III002660 [Babesia bovis T2Bo]EDO07830.1 hypothetical protein BBOV_III002660 [Babesia bovis T2Bo]|eukprot:XP_001611398.1 hypothetical protein [Babesia bovis T2Bo]
MNLVLQDPALLLLLRDVHHALAHGVATHVSFRKYVHSVRRCCHQCRFCKVSANLLEVASLISRTLANGYRELTVFLVVEEERQLYSTFVLDYIQSLYALVIQTYARYGADVGFCLPGDTVGILNPNTHNLTVLPLYDWRGLLDRAPQCSYFDSRSELKFLMVDGTPYVFAEFYNELARRGYVVDATWDSTVYLSTQVHRSCNGTTLDHASSEDSAFSQDDIDNQPKNGIVCVNRNTAVDSSLSMAYANTGQLDPLGHYQGSLEVNTFEMPSVIKRNIVDPINGETQANVDHVVPRFERSTSMPCCSVLTNNVGVSDHSMHTSLSFQDSGDTEILRLLREVDCLATYDSNHDQVTREILFFDKVMCCGTFDCLHFGHKYLLLAAFLSCYRALHIGITAPDAMLSKKIDFSLIQNLEKRRDAVKRYMCMLQVLYGPRTVVTPLTPNIAEGSTVVSYHNCDFFSYRTVPVALQKCTKLSYREFRAPNRARNKTDQVNALGPIVTTFDLMDQYGPAGVIQDSFALVISPESLPGAEKVNNLRRSKGLKVWPLLSAGFVLHPDHNTRRKSLKKVSSSWIRSGLKSIN